MSLFGSLFSSTASPSTTSTTSTSSTNVSTVDNRVASGSAAVGGNVSLTGNNTGPITISTTDQGAVHAGLDLARDSIAHLSSAINTTQSVAHDSISQAYDLANQARQSETSGAINELVKYLFFVAIVGIAAYAYTRSK